MKLPFISNIEKYELKNFKNFSHKSVLETLCICYSLHIHASMGSMSVGVTCVRSLGLEGTVVRL